MKRTTLQRALAAVSFLAVILGGAAVPASAAVESGQAAPMCWHDRCQL